MCCYCSNTPGQVGQFTADSTLCRQGFEITAVAMHCTKQRPGIHKQGVLKGLVEQTHDFACVQTTARVELGNNTNYKACQLIDGQVPTRRAQILKL